MNGLIRFSIGNYYAVVVMILTALLIGGLSLMMIPIDILPPFKSPAVQVLTFYGGMPAASIENDITNRMERWTGQAAGTARQESRSIIGASIVRNYYRDDIDPNGALTQVNSLASAAIPNLPPGTLPPVILPFDPTSTTPVCIVALDSQTQGESILYDTGRYEVRNMIMGIPGAVAPVVYGGKLRAVLAELDRTKMESQNLSPEDVMDAIDKNNIFLPTGSAKFGRTDFALDSNSMYELIDRMGDIPIKRQRGKIVFLRDVATPKDSSLIQTNIVRIDGRRQVYIPVFRQMGSSTLSVVEGLKSSVPDMKNKLTQPGIDLKVVMDQSVYVRQSISSLVVEGVLGAVLCSLVIFLFLGEWRMTLIAVITIPVAVLSALVCLYYTGNTINIMTLAGLSLAIGPLVDSAIICLENTHRHLGLGATPEEAAFVGASEVAMPELVASLCTLLVLAPLALMPGMGAFLFRPMALGVAFAMIAAYLLSRSVVPSFCALWLRPHAAHAEDIHGNDFGHRNPHEMSMFARAFARWEAFINLCIAGYDRLLVGFVMQHRFLVIGGAFGLLLLVLVGLGPKLRREFFPEVDAGAFEMYVRAPTGTRIEETEKRIAAVEKFVRKQIGHDLQLIISEIGVVADWSAAYTPNSGPMDSVVKIQLEPERHRSAQEYVHLLRTRLANPTLADDPEYTNPSAFSDLEFGFDAGGMIRSAMNEGKSTPINVRITGRNQAKAHQVALAIQQDVRQVRGVVDCRIMQRLDYPQYVVDVDQAKAAELGLSQVDVMKNLVAALNSSIQYNKKNFWIDPVSHNQYFVGVSYPEADIESVDTILDVPITSTKQRRAIPLRNMATVRSAKVPAEVTHQNLQPTIDLVMGVFGRDLGHVADDVTKVVKRFGKSSGRGEWIPFDPATPDKKPMAGSKIVISGEYSRMQDTFRNLGIGLVLASLLIYFLMVGLFKSWIVPFTIMVIVPLSLIGILPVLYLWGSAINVQSLLGFIFIIGIKVANTVLMTDFAQELREREKLTPTQAILKAASVRVRPVTMTALAAFFAMIPAALALEKGSEANAPLAQTILGGLLAGEPATLFVLPAIFSLMVRDPKRPAAGDLPESADPSHPTTPAAGASASHEGVVAALPAH